MSVETASEKEYDIILKPCIVFYKLLRTYSVRSKNYINKTEKKARNLSRSSKYHNTGIFNTVYGHSQTRLSVRSLNLNTYPKRGKTMKFSAALSFFGKEHNH